MTKRPFRKNEAPKLLDMGFCHPKIRPFVSGFNVGDDYGSQHSTISVQIPLKYQPKKSFSSKPNFKNANKKKFQEALDPLLPTIADIKIENKK